MPLFSILPSLLAFTNVFAARVSGPYYGGMRGKQGEPRFRLALWVGLATFPNFVGRGWEGVGGRGGRRGSEAGLLFQVRVSLGRAPSSSR